jgi:glycosyltransferase involved in cell wall biosynthesis
VNKQIVDISVIVANYNNGPFLKDLLFSVLNSTVFPKELIFIDDGSTDESLEIIEPYLVYDFIRVIKLEKNQGFANALNAGIKQATGRYIARIDPDDTMLPHRMERQVAFLEEHPEIDLVGGNVYYFNGVTGKRVLMSNFPSAHPQILAAYKSGDHGVQHPTVLVKAEVIRKYTYRQHQFPVEDYDLYARMIRDGHHFANLKEPVNRMRIHAGSISNAICFGTVDMTFALRDEIFGTKTSGLRRRRYFLFILFYRKFLYSRNYAAKLVYLLLASLFHPRKVLLKIASLLGIS